MLPLLISDPGVADADQVELSLAHGGAAAKQVLSLLMRSASPPRNGTALLHRHSHIRLPWYPFRFHPRIPCIASYSASQRPLSRVMREGRRRKPDWGFCDLPGRRGFGNTTRPHRPER
jgi:hypothetical protein